MSNMERESLFLRFYNAIYSSTNLKMCFILYAVSCLFIYIWKTCVVGKESAASRSTTTSEKNIVLITAHPDDECMFFSPTILAIRPHNNVYVLCVTTGNYHNKGDVRVKEIIQSCDILGIPAQNVEVFNDSSFPDDPHVNWNFEKLIKQIQNFMATKQIDIVFTFDGYGVSGHPNHIAVSKVISQITRSSNSSFEVPAVYQLESIPLWRKYISFLELPFSLGSADSRGQRLEFISPPGNVLLAQKAMFAHWSQLVWFRLLYILLSRYMVINTFTLLPS